MIHKTRGIVLKTTDYSETSVVVQVLTEKFGLQSYIVNGVKKPGAKIRMNILQPLYLLEMVVYHKPGGTVQRAAEMRHLPVFQSIPYDIVKSSIILFLNELLYKCIRQQNPDDLLFRFVFHAIELLDRMDDSPVNFHIVFLMRLSRFLGFHPGKSMQAGTGFFDLKSGEYTQSEPPHPYILHEPHTSYWQTLSEASFESSARLQFTPAERKYLLNKLIDYYRLHVDGLGEIRSHTVLEEVMHS